MSAETYYLLRFLPPKQSGNGEIVYALSSTQEPELKQLKKESPQLFQNLGFYPLMKATGQTLTTQ